MKVLALSVDQKKERLSKSLQDLAPDVTDKDKAAAELELGISRSTIFTYLKGDVANFPTAQALYDLLRELVLKRKNKRA